MFGDLPKQGGRAITREGDQCMPKRSLLAQGITSFIRPSSSRDRGMECNIYLSIEDGVTERGSELVLINID